VRPDADVGVVNDEVVVACVLHELGEVADFAVGAENFGAEDELDLAVGEIGLELADNGTGGGRRARRRRRGSRMRRNNFGGSGWRKLRRCLDRRHRSA